FRAMVNSQLWILRLAGNYYYTGKNYPGYFSNSTFYSANVSARLTSKLSVGVYSREDFKNAELDTFFVTAPYSKSFQTILNYNPARQAYLKVYWRTFERKDRMVLNKFHYLTKSLNTQFEHKFIKIEYTLLGEYGKTTNYLLEPANNRQTTYRGSVNLGYRFNSFNAIRVFGSWSNINSFVSGEQRNLIAGISAVSQITKNLNANFHLQNAYNIDDYYRNRNLMQLNLDYTFLRKHKLSLRSFYTIFRQQVENPELTFSLNYTYNFGIPVKQIIKGGDVKGRISYDNDAPAEGIILNLQNKTAITDKNGDFWFKNVPPGKQLLLVDRSGFEIEEITSIPTPIEIDVIEDQVSTINFKITKGARLAGKFTIEKNNDVLLNNSTETAGNIVVELKNDFEQFRITTDKAGTYSFPMVRPGKWIFKIYTTSVPSGYEISPSVYNVELKPGEEKNINPVLKSKKRKIIFKSQNMTLSATGTLSVQKNDKIETKQINALPKTAITRSKNEFYYTIQIGAFRKPLKPDSRFLKGEQFDYEKQIDNLYKYYIGKFSSYKKAQEAREKLKLKFKEAFIVTFKNGNPLPLK
ncbi:MAG TPA: carboxypeptidase regulatory-like domain-containing protein, partial [Draconibacterium sp.]|nr:carboxypeptidase regulatory-like domain-containing protein [Draconibacterium sp.]